MKLLPVRRLPEGADSFPEPLLCSLYDAAQITGSYRNDRDSRGGGHQAVASGAVQTDWRTHQHPPFPVDRMRSDLEMGSEQAGQHLIPTEIC